jgi:hypothetical protein
MLGIVPIAMSLAISRMQCKAAAYQSVPEDGVNGLTGCNVEHSHNSDYPTAYATPGTLRQRKDKPMNV